MSLSKAIKVAISPCPNDTFAFYYFFNSPHTIGKYEPVFLDIAELNQGMIENRWDVLKASFPAGIKAAGRYNLLKSGAAIGFGVGPIAVYQNEIVFGKNEWVIGLPGEDTTANFLWNYFATHTDKRLPENLVTRYMNFAEVMKRTVTGEIDLGVVIHEGRFVYKDLGLKLFQDLGEFWQEATGYPIPLGGIFARSTLTENTKLQIEADLKLSIQKALEEKNRQSRAYYDDILPFIKEYSQELSDEVIEQHIEYYVNSDTVELSRKAFAAINYFKDTYGDFQNNRNEK